MPKTLCGYELTDVRKSLREAIGRRDRRAAYRWAAELVATPGAIASLWAVYWISLETAADGNPTMPILLSQVWTNLSQNAMIVSDWAAFRNDEKVRRTVAEITTRLLDYPRQPIVTWPSKDVALYDVSTVQSGPSAVAADSQIVLSVWSRNHDSMDLRQLGGHWIEALQRGDLRIALSIIMWSLLPTTKLQCGPRGPASLPAGARNSPMWFWFSLGAALLKGTSAHPGWLTMHDDTVEAMTIHYKRWTATDRLRIFLFWTMQIRAVLANSHIQWSVSPVNIVDVDLPYKEIAAEMAGGSADTITHEPEKVLKKDAEKSKQSRVEEKMKAADDKILAMMGII